MGKADDPQKELDAWLERDLTKAALAGELPTAYEVEPLIGRVVEVLVAGRSPVLVGESGVGKTAVIEEIVRRAARGEIEPLKGKRVLQLSLRRCASTLNPQKEQIGERMLQLIQALAQLGDEVVVYFRDFHLAYALDVESQFEAIAFRLPNPLFGEGPRAPIDSMMEYQPGLQRQYVLLDVHEPSLERAGAIVRAWAAEPDRGVSFEPDALETALGLAHRFLARGRLPRKALEPLAQLAVLKRGGTVTEGDVVERFSASYGLPRFLVDPTVRLDLDAVRKSFSEVVLGQPEAVDAVLRVISLMKSGLSDPRRPFGVFLFVGPTGVGKTYLAQRLAEYLFGDADRIIRFNMADFPEDSDADTFFGEPDDNRVDRRRGVLTQRIMGHPFAVLLLDEFEKASSKVHDRCLQLFDEGSFINGAGERIPCRSLIVIVTSNTGAEAWRGGMLGFAAPSDPAKVVAEVDRRLQEEFRFEFLNRFDQVVHFRPLGRPSIRTIALRELTQLRDRAGLKQRRLGLEIDEGLLDWLTVNGYDPFHGARFLRRAIERHVATALADLLVREAPERGASLRLSIRKNEVRARLEAPAADEDRPAEAAVGGDHAGDLKNLDLATLQARADGVVAAAAGRLEELAKRQEEYRELLEQINAPGFWSAATRDRPTLDRFRELDVSIRVERRLAEPIETLAELRERSKGVRRGTLVQAHREAVAALREWDERSAEEGRNAVWIVVSKVDPSRPTGDWVAKLVEMELAWCRRLDLDAEIVAYATHADELVRVGLEVEGPGAEVYLQMERGLHRQFRASGGALRAAIDVVPRTLSAPDGQDGVREIRPRKGTFDLETRARATFELRNQGQVQEFVGVDGPTLGWFLADLRGALVSAPSDPPDTARVYGEDGAGARDPRTGAVLARLRDAMRGEFGDFLERWRRRGGPASG